MRAFSRYPRTKSWCMHRCTASHVWIQNLGFVVCHPLSKFCCLHASLQCNNECNRLELLQNIKQALNQVVMSQTELVTETKQVPSELHGHAVFAGNLRVWLHASTGNGGSCLGLA